MTRTHKDVARLGYENEKDFVKKLNKDRKNFIWKKIGYQKNIDHYFIKVKGNKDWQPAKKSIIQPTKIQPKTDVFIAKGKINLQQLISNDYYLDENDLLNNKLSPINGSGISIKLSKSNCQWDKCSPDKFFYRYGSYELFAGMSLYITSEKFKNNHKIIKACKSNWKKMGQYFDMYKAHLHKLDPKISLEEKDRVIFKKIQNFSREKIYQIALKNQLILDSIFSGKNEFKEPYCASWFYYDNVLTKKYPNKFTVTQGSGRSKNRPLISFKY